ncbi:MAG: hypothetical protein A2231_10825 [Candidatus Firestonebacteria bacterium RIFOXYA2_FULL_40_8]|nr:MAG: hypothetical protein A2231_10825 [Candidatus Firestonebacteria bacterium RIFOXYA2_FULL_40_8]
MKKKQKINQKIALRSSAAEYLTFVAAVGNQETAIEMRYEDENIWLTQKLMAELYGVSVQAIDQHTKTLIKAGELDASTIKQYLIVQNEGKRVVQDRLFESDFDRFMQLEKKLDLPAEASAQTGKKVKEEDKK